MRVIYYLAPLLLGAGFVGLCVVLRAEDRGRRRSRGDDATIAEPERTP